MSNEQIIKCTFCHGTGNNPHFRGICPVCKGRGKNEVAGKYMVCSSCRGSGQKGGTTLTCYDCRGLGVVPDTRETFMKAREEIREAREEMAEELTGKPMIKMTKKSKNYQLSNVLSKLKRKNEENNGKAHFCQCCGNEVNESVTIKICPGCFSKVKELRAHKEI